MVFHVDLSHIAEHVKCHEGFLTCISDCSNLWPWVIKRSHRLAAFINPFVSLISLTVWTGDVERWSDTTNSTHSGTPPVRDISATSGGLTPHWLDRKLIKAIWQQHTKYAINILKYSTSACGGDLLESRSALDWQLCLCGSEKTSSLTFITADSHLNTSTYTHRHGHIH